MSNQIVAEGAGRRNEVAGDAVARFTPDRLTSADASALTVPGAHSDLTQLGLPLGGKADLPPAMPITAGGVPDTGAMRSMGLTKQADRFDANVAVAGQVRANVLAAPWGQRGARMAELELRTGQHRSTLYRKAAKKAAELVPAWRTGRGATKCIPPELQSQIIETRLRRPHASVAAIYNDLVIPHFAGDGRMCPHLTTVRHFLRVVVQPIAAALYRRGPAYFTMHCAPKVRRDLPTEPNQLWSVDHVKLDTWVVCSDGHLRRLWATVVFDGATGALLAWRLGRTPTGAGVCHALHRAISDWGVPRLVQRDGGLEFLLRHLDGDRERLLNPRAEDVDRASDWPAALPTEVERGGVWEIIGADVTTTLPRKPWGKLAETLIGAFFSWHVELPGYCGRSAASQPEWLARQKATGQILTEGEYEHLLEKRAEQWNNTHVVGTRSASPFTLYLAYNNQNPGALWRPDLAALSFLLQQTGTFKVFDDGLHFGKQTWWGDGLEYFVGCTVTVRYGEDGDPIGYAYTQTGHVIPLAPEPRATWTGWSEANLRAESRLTNQKTYLKALMLSVAASAPAGAIDPTGAHRLVAERLKAAAVERARQERARTDALTRPPLQLPELAAVARQITKARTRRESEERELLTKGVVPPGDAPLPERLAQAVDTQMLLAADIETLRSVLCGHGLRQGQVGGLCGFKRDKVHRLLTGKGSAKKQAVELPRLRQAVMALLAAKGAIVGGAAQ